MRRSLLPLCLLIATAQGGCATGRPGPQLTADNRLHMADAAAASGDEDLAVSMYTAAAASAPQSTPVQLHCAAALAKAGRIAQARQLLSARLMSSHGDPDVVRALAALDLSSGQIDAAIAALDQALAAKPDDPAVLADKGVALDLQQRHTEAQAVYRHALRHAPDDPSILNDLAISLMLQGKVHEAIAVLAPLQSGAGLPQRARINLGLLYALDGDLDRARQLIGHDVSPPYLADVAKAVAAMRLPPSS